MLLTFPLKSGVQLMGHLSGGSHRLTVGYGRPSKVSGTLRDASGQPLADQDVTVTEYFGDGALIDTRGRTVRTDSDGRWKERLPGGPSRTVGATYEGTRRYLPDATTAGALDVKTKASLHISNHRVHEGHRVAFKGRIGHLAARIPAGGNWSSSRSRMAIAGTRFAIRSTRGRTASIASGTASLASMYRTFATDFASELSVSGTGPTRRR